MKVLGIYEYHNLETGRLAQGDHIERLATLKSPTEETLQRVLADELKAEHRREAGHRIVLVGFMLEWNLQQDNVDRCELHRPDELHRDWWTLCGDRQSLARGPRGWFPEPDGNWEISQLIKPAG